MFHFFAGSAFHDRFHVVAARAGCVWAMIVSCIIGSLETPSGAACKGPVQKSICRCPTGQNQAFDASSPCF
eukprot:1814484-Pleurochrysis_carterae.AAC.3